MDAKISMRILAKMAEGMTVRQAIDAVLGDGTSAKLVSDIYDTMKTKTA